ncbi:glycosyltransferase family 4 protein [Anditalea andensis]|uniref:Group 1 glycosyl transferase n=1 Tax=Anditalea andensis TaxID=1048983 RepID=A0A074L1D3_9BACT|nr:glycosyltransferase family 1 protein [Anditalea andensis]KEO73633.1 group 1 glycosyl transferase [Anditalea andensis]
MKKKVLIDIYYLHVAQTGIKTYTETLCSQVLTYGGNEFDFIITPDPDKIKKSKFYKGKTSRWKNLLFQTLYFLRKQLVVPIMSYRYNVDIVFCPDIMIPLWGRGKMISVIHDAFFWENPTHYHRLWLKYFVTFLKWGLSNKGHVVTITDFSKKQLKKHLEVGTQMYVAWPASNLSASNLYMDLPDLIGSPYFLHVGVLEKRKNISLLIEAFALFVVDQPEYKLVLVGQSGPRKNLNDHENLIYLINHLDINDKVILTGHVELKALQSYYKHAVGYIFPSKNEGFGLPVLEAFSYKLPVIITPQGALMEVGGDAVLIAEPYPEDLASKMFLLSENENLRKTLGQLGSQRLTNFTPQKFFITLKDIFKQVLNE